MASDAESDVSTIISGSSQTAGSRGTTSSRKPVTLHRHQPPTRWQRILRRIKRMLKEEETPLIPPEPGVYKQPATFRDRIRTIRRMASLSSLRRAAGPLKIVDSRPCPVGHRRSIAELWQHSISKHSRKPTADDSDEEMPEELPFWGINKDGRFPINYSSTQTHMNNPPVTSAEERHQSSECPKLDLLNGMHGNSLARSSTFRASLEQAADDINDKYGLSRIPSSSEEPFPLSGDTSNCPAASLGRYVKPSSKHVSTDGTLPDRPKSGSYMEKKEPCVPDDSQCESSKETPVNEPNEASEEPLRPQDAAGSEVSPA